MVRIEDGTPEGLTLQNIGRKAVETYTARVLAYGFDPTDEEYDLSQEEVDAILNKRPIRMGGKTLTKARYDALVTAAVCNFTVHSSDGISKEQQQDELAVASKEWADAETSLTTEGFEAWQTARRNEHTANFAELMVATRSELDALLFAFDDLFGDRAAIIIKKHDHQ